MKMSSYMRRDFPCKSTFIYTRFLCFSR